MDQIQVALGSWRASAAEQVYRLQQIGLARPVRAVKHHRAGGELQPCARIGAEVGEGEGGDQEASDQSAKPAEPANLWD